jgi:hypothetical protein
MLLLSAQPTLVHDQKPGNRFRGIGTEIIVDQRQNEIDSRGHSSRGPVGPSLMNTWDQDGHDIAKMSSPT